MLQRRFGRTLSTLSTPKNQAQRWMYVGAPVSAGANCSVLRIQTNRRLKPRRLFGQYRAINPTQHVLHGTSNQGPWNTGALKN
ncbi:MAG: hypothetical protein ACI8PT_003258 [Gammaproteobacteria bacterium]|jgi:hypothetical protein